MGRKIPDKAFVNGCSFRVRPHKFWIGFNQGKWEPDLQSFLRRHVSNGKVVLDIGAWYGPSLLTALCYHPLKVISVEANPNTFNILKDNIEKNELGAIVDLHNVCLSDRGGERINFGTMDEYVPHSAIHGIGGSGFELITTSFQEFLKTINPASINIIKIDVEGGERFLGQGLRYVSGFRDLKIYLALHPPFWPEKKKVAQELLKAFELFEIYTSKEEELPLDELSRMMLSERKTHYPGRTGRFFDIILKSLPK